MTSNREHLHELVDRLAPRQVMAMQELLEAMLDPVSRAIANAPIDDEPETDEERQAVAEANQWFKENPEGIPFEDVLAEFGLTVSDIKSHRGE